MDDINDPKYRNKGPYKRRTIVNLTEEENEAL